MDFPEKVERAMDKIRDESGAIELSKFLEAGVPLPAHGDKWGHWKFDAKNLVLTYFNDQGQSYYEINLESMTSSAQMLDWIFQVNMKTWASRKDIGDFVQALDDLFMPQANLCSGGVDKSLDASKFLHKRFQSSQRS